MCWIDIPLVTPSRPLGRQIPTPKRRRHETRSLRRDVVFCGLTGFTEFTVPIFLIYIYIYLGKF